MASVQLSDDASSSPAASEPCVWTCPTCSLRVTAATPNNLLQHARYRHQRRAHPCTTGQRWPKTFADPSVGEVISTSDALPPSLIAWQCPLCTHALPELGRRMQHCATQRHHLECHAVVSARHLQRLQRNQHLGGYRLREAKRVAALKGRQLQTIACSQSIHPLGMTFVVSHLLLVRRLCVLIVLLAEVVMTAPSVRSRCLPNLSQRSSTGGRACHRQIIWRLHALWDILSRIFMPSTSWMSLRGIAL